jgi:hypothetical protein
MLKIMQTPTKSRNRNLCTYTLNENNSTLLPKTAKTHPFKKFDHHTPLIPSLPPNFINFQTLGLRNKNGDHNEEEC